MIGPYQNSIINTSSYVDKAGEAFKKSAFHPSFVHNRTVSEKIAYPFLLSANCYCLHIVSHYTKTSNSLFFEFFVALSSIPI